MTAVQNITDVGHMTDESSPEAVDKMLLAVEDEGLQPLEIAEKYTKEALEDMAAVGSGCPTSCRRRPSTSPR